MRKNSKDISQYFVKKLHYELNSLDVTIFQEIEKTKQDASNKGMLRSGMTLDNISNVIIDNTLNSCKEKLNLIDEFQDYLKFKIPDKYLPEIKEIYHSNYVPFLIKKINNTYVVNAKQSNWEDYQSVTNQFQLDNSLQSLDILIANKIEDISIKNRLKKDEPSVRLAKVSIIISSILMFVGLGNIAISIYLNFF